MERLTNKAWANLDPWECCGQDNYCKRGCHEEGGCNNGCIVPRLYKRLARYEDTGLSPDQVELMDKLAGINNEHITKRIVADGNVSLALLPCRPGDKVWRICGPRGRKFVSERWVVSVEWTGDAFIIHSTADDVLGRTVFLTREEAETSLKGEANGKDA